MWHLRGSEMGFTRQHPASKGFRLPAPVPYQKRKFACGSTKYNASFVRLLDSLCFSRQIFATESLLVQDECFQQSLTLTWGSMESHKNHQRAGTPL